MQADEEQLLLEAIDMAGFGNWTAVAEHVGSKSKEECKVQPHCLNDWVENPSLLQLWSCSASQKHEV